MELKKTLLNNKKIIVSIIVVLLGLAALLGYKNIINKKMDASKGAKEYILVVRDVDNTFNNELKGGNGIVNSFIYDDTNGSWTHKATEDSTP